MVLKDDFAAFKVMIFHKLFFYFQGLLVVIQHGNINRGLFYFILPILKVCNLSFDFAHGHEGICFFSGMTAEQEVLLGLTGSGLLLTVTGLLLITQTTCCGDIKWMKICCIFRCHCCFIDWKLKRDGEVTYYSAFLKALVISIGPIMTVMFKMLSWRVLSGSDLTVHYYYGDTPCYDSHWFIALAALAGLLVIWFIFHISLWHHTPAARQSAEGNHLFTLVEVFKPKYWYWETVMLLRRILVALLSIAGDPYHYSYIILMVSLCLFLIAQVHYR